MLKTYGLTDKDKDGIVDNYSSVYDKIVNHFVANYYLIPYLEKKLLNSNVNPNIVRFVLKIGTDYKFDNLSFVTNKKDGIK